MVHVNLTRPNPSLFCSLHPKLWNGSRLIDLGSGSSNEGMLFALNEQNQVIGVDGGMWEGAEGFLWEDGQKTHFREMLPKNMQGQISGVRPFALSNQRSSATPLAADPSLCVLTSWNAEEYAPIYYTTALVPAAAADEGFGVFINQPLFYPTTGQPTQERWRYARIGLPENVSVDGYIGINPQGVLTCTGCADTSKPQAERTSDVMLLLPVEFVEITPALKDETGANFSNSTKPKSIPANNDMAGQAITGQIPKIAYPCSR